LGGPTWQTHRDAHGERALAKALLRAKEKQITAVTITQRAALLQSVDKIMILHQGAVQAFGSRDEIIQSLPAVSRRISRAGRATRRH
jgi:ABC-type protease/lipase transport system fused ATPase/permease subunit